MSSGRATDARGGTATARLGADAQGGPDAQNGSEARVEALIDLAALQANVRTLSQIAAPSRVMLAVKANAYGHGIIEVARAGLQASADSLAVLDIPSGLLLREAGFTVPILAWLHAPESDFAAAVDAGIELGISALWQLDAIEDAARPTPAIVHLKIDTGLSRNGASAVDWPALVERAAELRDSGVVRIRAIWSHLADASHADDEAALARLHVAVARAAERGVYPEILHLAASSAGIDFPEARLDLVRFGIAAYGVSPFDDRSGADLGLTPTMTLRARITAVLDDGAVVGCGFADGVLPRGAGRAQVAVGATRWDVREIGPDSLLIARAGSHSREGAPDESPAVGLPSVGDSVTVFGPGTSGEPTPEDWARWCDTIGDEVVASVASRVPRVYLH